MQEYIVKFDGTENRFLSNFYPAPIDYEGKTYVTSEHAYQAAKTMDDAEREVVRSDDSPKAAKKNGRKVTLRPNWDSIKSDIMLDIVLLKLKQHKDLANKLLATGDKILVEGNYWHDNWFGVCSCEKCNGIGKNVLGQVLMMVREELRGTKNSNTIRRGHEECCYCSKAKTNPPICKGHMEGPIACLEFEAKDKGKDVEDIILETV